MPVSGRYGNPAPSSPPMPVPERVQTNDMVMPDGKVVHLDNPAWVTVPQRPATVTSIREQMQSRAESLRAQIASLQAAKDELALIERMLEVK